MKVRPLQWISLWLALAAVVIQPVEAEAADVAVAFSPGQGRATAEELVLEAIGQARHSIRLAAYSLTSKTIAEALIDARYRGVDVEAVLDRTSRTARNSGAQLLIGAGVPVRVNSQYSVMHNKFMVIDGETVQTGSFSYSTAASEENAENVLLIRRHAAFAAEYEREWQRLWQESDRLAAKY